MKLVDIVTLTESKDENADLFKTPPPGDTGEYITTAQAAKLLGVTMSRVRQLIADGFLTVRPPKKGRRDNMLKVTEVLAHKQYMKDHKGGRPSKDEEEHIDSIKDKKKKEQRKQDQKLKKKKFK